MDMKQWKYSCQSTGVVTQHKSRSVVYFVHGILLARNFLTNSELIPMKVVVFWVTTLCNVVAEYQRFEGKVNGEWCCLHLQKETRSTESWYPTMASQHRWWIFTTVKTSNIASDWYVNNILNHFFKQVTAEERQYGYIQHIHRIISKRFWPPVSPYVCYCVFYLWGSIRAKLYKNNSQTANALPNEIMDIHASVPEVCHRTCLHM